MIRDDPVLTGKEQKMAKEFYTERDIEDLCKRGVMSLEINDDVVLTELAYEKAGRLGMQLHHTQPENPPSAPVRPYLSQKQFPHPLAPVAASEGSPPKEGQVAEIPPRSETVELQQRIHKAVVARLGTAVDPQLLDVIILRVLNSIGAK